MNVLPGIATLAPAATLPARPWQINQAALCPDEQGAETRSGMELGRCSIRPSMRWGGVAVPRDIVHGICND
jgi:hypothetical protein